MFPCYDAGACNGTTVTCPPGIPCAVECVENGTCDHGVDCTKATACRVSCIGDTTCQTNPVACTGFSCDVACTGAGSCTVTASQAGNVGYAAATPVTQTFSIAKAAVFVNANDASTQFGQTPTLGYPEFIGPIMPNNCGFSPHKRS